MFACCVVVCLVCLCRLVLLVIRNVGLGLWVVVVGRFG